MASTSRTKKKNGVKLEDVPIIIISSDESFSEPREPKEPRAPRPKAQTHKAHSPKAPKARKPITFTWDWKREVTDAVADLNRKQTLHVPAWVVRKYLRNKHQVFVRSAESEFSYCCSVMAPPERGSSVRYLREGWYDYLDDHMPEVGDALLFDMERTPNCMVVKLLRAKDRGR